MKLSFLALLGLGALLSLASPTPATIQREYAGQDTAPIQRRDDGPSPYIKRPPSKPFSTFDEVVVFVPPANYTDPKVLYARTVLLENGNLLATWENYSPEPPPVYFPIFKSTDGGLTWHEISRVTDQVNHWGLRYQPMLYELPAAVGAYPAGTVLLAGNSIPTNLSNTQIDVYASLDKGYTWHFVSHVAAGGEAVPDDGLTPVWEPFLKYYDGQIICYYSDQRDPLHGQKLSHQVSADLKHWGPVVDDVAYSDYYARPGMTTVAELPNRKWIMTYEYGGAPGFTDYSFPVYYRISNSPLTFNSSVGYPILPINNGSEPFSSPYIVWSPAGGKNGTIAVSCGTLSTIFINKALGAIDQWVEYPTPAPVAYSRSLTVMNNPEHLLIAGAGHLPPSTTNNVTVTVIDLP